MSNKKFRPKELLWALYSLVIALLIHFFAPGYLFVQFFKYLLSNSASDNDLFKVSNSFPRLILFSW